MGIVRRVLHSISSMLYLLDDMTGAPIDARFWYDSEVSAVQVGYCDMFSGMGVDLFNVHCLGTDYR